MENKPPLSLDEDDEEEETLSSPLPVPVIAARRRPICCWFLRNLCAIIWSCLRMLCCFCFCKSAKVTPAVSEQDTRRKPVEWGQAGGDRDQRQQLYQSPADSSEKAFSARTHQVVDIDLVGGTARHEKSAGFIIDLADDSPSSRAPRTLVINREVTSTQLDFYLDHEHSFKLLTIEFDLRQFPCRDTSETVFQILQRAFLHPNVQELRIRIDNWRNYIHQKENLLLKDDKIGTSIRSEYPMNLNSLVIYCPGVTLGHLFIYRGFIISQVNLTTLICNFDSIMWRFYKPILKAVSKTISKLELYSITNYNGSISKIELFNWKHIARLKNLRFLKMWGDARYYGLRHRNLTSSSVNQLIGIELKYVDLSVEDIDNLLSAHKLVNINVQFFTPIQPLTHVAGIEFIDLIGAALIEQKLDTLSFTDHKLPGSIMQRHFGLCSHAEQLGYTSTWTTPDNAFDLMTFERQPGRLQTPKIPYKK